METLVTEFTNVLQVLHLAAGDGGVLLPDVAADQGPQAPRVGLGDDPGAGHPLQVRGGLLGHQKCLPGQNYRYINEISSFYLSF